jgi:AraC-like DNA-binding protein
MITEILKNHRLSPQVLVESKISFADAESELSIYDTFEQANRIELASDQLMFCGMVTGKKIMHACQEDFECDFLPHESFVMAPNAPVEIDFPIASMNQPTTCLAIEICSERVQKIANGLNAHASLEQYERQWQYDAEMVHTHHNTQTQELLNRMVHIYSENHQDRSFMIDLAVTELIVRLLRHQTREFIISHSQTQPDHNGLNAVVSFLKDNLEKNLDIDSLCKLACMSRSKFFTEFKIHLGCTPKDFLYQIRLKQAAKMLRAGSSITHTCFTTGFTSNSHFSRSFKACFGMSPSQFKERH